MALDVLIPHYRDLDGFTASLNSIVEQTWSGDIRLVVVDDGSPENEFLALRRHLDKQPLPFHLERNDANRGRPYTRNRLLDCIDSDYVAWQDAGDLWYPEKIARQFEHISRLRFAGENIDNVWITCDYDWRRDGGRCYLVEQIVSGDQLRSLILGEELRAYLWTILAPANTMRAVGWFDEELPRLQDLDFFIRFIRAGGRIETPPKRKALCLYEKSDVGRSAREIRRCNRRIFEKNQTSYEKYGREFLATARFNAETLSARYAKNNGNTLSRFYYLSKALLAHPSRAANLARSWVAQFAG